MRTVASLALTALLVSMAPGCMDQPDDSPTGPVFVDEGADAHPDAFSQITRANMADAGAYKVVKLSLAVDADEVREFCERDDVILGAVNVKKIPAWDTPRLRSLHMRLQEKWFYHDDSGNRVQVGPWNTWELKPSLQAMEVLAQWTAETFGEYSEGGPGGVYVDQVGPGLPKHTFEQLEELDGVDMHHLQMQYRAASIYFLARLRDLCPDPFIIVPACWSDGKAEYWATTEIRDWTLPRSTLELMNGIAIEYPVVQDLRRFEQAAYMARGGDREVVSIAWGRPGWRLFDLKGVMLYGGTFE